MCMAAEKINSLVLLCMLFHRRFVVFFLCMVPMLVAC